MARVRVIVVAAVVIAAWVLNATSITKGWVLPLIAATVALSMLFWAEWARHEAKWEVEALENRIAVITDRSGETRPRWYPGESVIWAKEEDERNIAWWLHALRTNRLASGSIRCTVEDPDGLVTVARKWAPDTVKPGHQGLLFNYPSDFHGARPPREGI